MNKRARIFSETLAVALATMALSGPAWSQVTAADDNTSDPGCGFTYNDPDCWNIGVVPSNNGTNYSVTLNDATPLTLDTNITVNSLMIGSGSAFTISNNRTFTLIGDSGGGDSGMLMIDGLLTLGSTNLNSTLAFNGGMSTISATALPMIGTPTLTSTTSSRNNITGAGTAPQLMVERQNIWWTGSVGNFESLTFSDSLVHANMGTTLEVADAGQVTAGNTGFTSSGAGTLMVFMNTDLDGTNTSTMVAEDGGTIEHSGGLVTNWGYDVRDDLSRIVNRDTVIDNNVYNIGAGGAVQFEGRNGRVENNNQFTIGADGAVEFRNASDTILAAGTVFFQDTGGVVRSLDTGNLTRQYIEGNGGDAVTFRSATLPVSNVYSYDTTGAGRRNDTIGSGDTPRVVFENQRKRATGTMQDLDEITYDNSRVEPNAGSTYAYDGVNRVIARDTEFRASGANTRFAYNAVDLLDGTGTSTMVVEDGGTIEHSGGLVTNWGYDVRDDLSRIVNRDTVIDNNVYNIGAGGAVQFEGRNGRVENNNQFTIGADGAVEFRNASDTILAAGTVFFQDTGGVVRSLDTGNLTRQYIEGNGGDAVTFRSATLPVSNVYSYDTTGAGRRNDTIGSGDTPRVVFENQRKRATGTMQDLDEITYDNSRVEPNAGSTYAYDGVNRVIARDTEFRASGANTRFAYNAVDLLDGTGTSTMVVEDGGTIEHSGGLVTNWGYDVRDDLSRIVNRDTVIDNNVYNIGAGGAVQFEGRNGRVENNNQFTIGADGAVEFRNASDTILAAGTVFFQDTGGVVRSLDTGNLTRQYIEGNGGDAVTFRSATLPVSNVYSYDTTGAGRRNDTIGSGDTPRVVFENQRKRATGTMQDLDEITYDNSRVEPNAGSTYAYDGVNRVIARDTEFRASGANTRFAYNAVDLLDGTGTSTMVVEDGGTIEHSGGLVTNWGYDVRANVINSGVTHENNTLDIGLNGVFAYNGAGNSLRRSNTVNVDGGQIQFRNASTTDVEDGVIFDIENGGSVATNGNILTTVNFGGITADPVVFRSSAFQPGTPSIASSTRQGNTWNGVGPAANLNFQRQLVFFTGTWQNFDNVVFDNSEVANNPGSVFILQDVNRVAAQNSLIQSRGAGGEIRIVNAFFDGTNTAVVEATDNAVIDFTGGRSFDFFGSATNGSTIEFNGQILSGASIGTDATSRVILNNTAVDKVRFNGNTQVGGQFTLSGGDNQFDALITDPFQNTTVTLDGASLDAPLTFSDRPGNSLGGTGPIVINNAVSGAATLDGAVQISATGSVSANGNNPIVFDQPGSVNNGLVEATEGGSVIVNEDVTGTGRWSVSAGRFGIGANTTLGFLNGTNVSADQINVGSGGTFRLDGGTARANSILVEVGAELILASTLSTNRLTIGLTDESAWNPSATTIVEMTGGEGAAIGDWSDWGVLEIAGLDQGNDPGGFLDNFEIPILEIGAGASVFLRDIIDNGNRGGPGGQSEALYVDTLVFQDGFSVLNLNGLNLYFNDLVGDQSQIINQVVPLPPALWLFGSALAGLGWLRRRRQAAN